MAQYLELVALFFIQGAALGMWFVPLSNILDAHGLKGIRPYAFAASAIAAFISPLIFGAMADRHVSPVKVLRGLSFATALVMALTMAYIAFFVGHGKVWYEDQHPFLFVLLGMVFIFCGPGPWSIDRLRAKEKIIVK